MYCSCVVHVVVLCGSNCGEGQIILDSLIKFLLAKHDLSCVACLHVIDWTLRSVGKVLLGLPHSEVVDHPHSVR